MSNIDASFLSYVKESTKEDYEQKKAYLALLRDRYKDTISTLPKEKGWLGENLYQYKGFWYSFNDIFSIETCLALQDTFRAHPTDIYMVTLPKSGTTWMKALVFAIVNREKYRNNVPVTSHPLLIHNPHNCVPYIEKVLVKTSTYTDERNPRIFASHAPYTLLPRSILDSGCRLVYVCRNPKDVFVSLFHFMKSRVGSCEMSFNEAFEMFRNGASPFGPYWDHVKGYYKASLEHQSKNIIFLTYEGMYDDTTNHVKHLAKFLGYPFSEDEEARGVVRRRKVS